MNKESFCILPWIHLATHPIGTVTPCCVTDMENDMSTAKKDGLNVFLGKDKLDEITNSTGFNNLRKKMVNGEKPSECKNCYFYEEKGLYSKRMESNEKFPHLIDDAYLNTNEDGSLKNVNYKYIELRLGTVCNLKCVTCNPFSSNRWNEDINSFKGTEFEKSYFKCDVRTEWFRDINFYDDLLKKCDELEEVWINGGEPTLIKEHTHFLQRLIETGRSKDVNLHYSINMTDIPDNFINIWKQFKKVRIHLSIDDLKERNDYIRYGSKWENIVKNFEKILNHKDIFNLEVCQTLSAYNVYNIDNFKKMCLDYDLVVAHNYVHHPSFQHVSIIPEEMKTEILSNIKYLTTDEKNRLITELNKKDETNTLDKFKKFVIIIDNKRKVNIVEFLPEWKKYFNE